MGATFRRCRDAYSELRHQIFGNDGNYGVRHLPQRTEFIIRERLRTIAGRKVNSLKNDPFTKRPPQKGETPSQHEIVTTGGIRVTDTVDKARTITQLGHELFRPRCLAAQHA